MVAPLTVGPLAMKAAIYHQGEADCDGWYAPGAPLDFEHVYSWYSCHLQALIKDWTDTFGLSYFGVSMLQPYAGDCASNGGCRFVPAVRKAQMDVANSLPHSTYGVTTDLGDPTAPAGSVHSRHKAELAARLAAGFASVAYGQASLSGPFLGPLYLSAADASVQGSELAAEVAFEPSSAEGGLQLILNRNGTSWCPVGQSATAPSISDCSWFSLLGSASGWVNASRVELLNGTAVRLSAPSALAGDTVLATAWGQNSYPVCVLFNAVGLPVSPWNESLV
jgi:hypothetical protein